MPRDMNSLGRTPGESTGRSRAAAVLTGVATLAALLLIGLGFAVSGLISDDPRATSVGGADSPRSPDNIAEGGEAAGGELELVTRPMLALPDQAALPHALSDRDAGPALVLPVPATRTGRLVPGGLPSTPEGALAQLVELTRAGTAGGDPGVYDAAYSEASGPGAPTPASSYVHQQLAGLRSHGGLRPTGAVPGLTITWTPTSGLIKGTVPDADGGSLAVVCVLGQLDVDYQGRVVSAGLGDCQALRRVDGEWRIAAGPPAAVAPSAWPGSSEAVAAGYRDLR